MYRPHHVIHPSLRSQLSSSFLVPRPQGEVAQPEARPGRASRAVILRGTGRRKTRTVTSGCLAGVDDVMNVSGHRMSTTEIESALVSHPKVAEAAVVGATDPMTGQAIVAFVILRGDAGTADRTWSANCARMCQGDRPDRQAAPDHGGPGATEDPIGEDHAPAAARHRREPGARRRHDTDRLVGDEPDQGEPHDRQYQRRLTGERRPGRTPFRTSLQISAGPAEPGRVFPHEATDVVTNGRRIVLFQTTGRDARTIADILRQETVGGALMLAAAVVAMVWANLDEASYEALRHLQIGPLDAEHWAADGLLTIFFFVAGLELKRELTVGSLSRPAEALVPIVAALCGMAVPALIYLVINLPRHRWTTQRVGNPHGDRYCLCASDPCGGRPFAAS